MIKSILCYYDNEVLIRLETLKKCYTTKEIKKEIKREVIRFNHDFYLDKVGFDFIYDMSTCEIREFYDKGYLKRMLYIPHCCLLSSARYVKNISDFGYGGTKIYSAKTDYFYWNKKIVKPNYKEFQLVTERCDNIEINDLLKDSYEYYNEKHKGE